jgi:hypothetical protein
MARAASRRRCAACWRRVSGDGEWAQCRERHALGCGTASEGCCGPVRCGAEGDLHFEDAWVVVIAELTGLAAERDRQPMRCSAASFAISYSCLT